MSDNGNLFHNPILEQALHEKAHKGAHELGEIGADAPTISEFKAILSLPFNSSASSSVANTTREELIAEISSMNSLDSLRKVTDWLRASEDSYTVNLLRIVYSYQGSASAAKAFVDDSLETQAMQLFAEALENERKIIAYAANRGQRRIDKLATAGKTVMAGGGVVAAGNLPLGLLGVVSGGLMTLAAAVAEKVVENLDDDAVDSANYKLRLLQSQFEGDKKAEALSGWCVYKRPSLGLLSF
jgi:hypothetical protein